jgi:hypothetical protein
VLSEHVDELQSMSKILIEFETFDRDQFERLVAGESAEEVFKDVEKPETETPAPVPKKEPARPRGLGLPLPGNIATGSPPESPQPS